MEATKARAASLKGRISYCEAQNFGRCGALAAAHLSDIVTGRGLPVLSTEAIKALLIARWIVVSAPPRVISPWNTVDKNVLFLDGAAEGSSPQKVTVGGVIFSPRLEGPQFFGFEVASDVVAHWTSTGSKQVIDQAEVFPALVAKLTWKSTLACAKNLFFIDNESARENLIRGRSNSWASRELLLACRVQDARAQSLDWYARVPSRANIADDPSRLKFGDLLRRGWNEAEVHIPVLQDWVDIDVLKVLCH